MLRGPRHLSVSTGGVSSTVATWRVILAHARQVCFTGLSCGQFLGFGLSLPLRLCAVGVRTVRAVHRCVVGKIRSQTMRGKE